MFIFLSKVVRRTAYTALGLAFTAAVGPFAYEAVHNERQQNRIEESIGKITQEKFFICDPSAAAQLEEKRTATLANIMLKSTDGLSPSWSEPSELYHDGLLRLSNAAPFVARLAEKATGPLPKEYSEGYFATALDNARKNLAALADLGIGICFDKALMKAGAGSAYLRDEGLLVLNPMLTEDALSLHIRRHLAQLQQELVAPQEHLLAEKAENFAARAEAWQKFSEHLQGPALVLPAEEDANAAPFKEAPRKNHVAPYL